MVDELVPVRMLNEWVYCPRLFYLMHVEGQMAANADVWKGRYRHAGRDKPVERSSRRRRKESPRGEESSPGEPPEAWREATSFSLGSESLGLVGKLDTVLLAGRTAVPVELKKGRAPTKEQEKWCLGDLWLSDAIQLGAQALLLREQGYDVPRVEAYYGSSRKLVSMEVDAELDSAVRDAVIGARECQRSGRSPSPLVDSPKCPRCSLNEVCLPDESALLESGVDYLEDPDGQEPPVRRVIPTRIEESILVVEATGATVRKRGDALTVEVPPALAESRGLPRQNKVSFDSLHEVCFVGAVQVTAQAMTELLVRGIPVSYLTRSGRLLGTTLGMLGNNVELRVSQHELHRDEAKRLEVARVIVRAKIRNQRTLLRRNDRGEPADALNEMSSLASAATKAAAVDELMGLEGRAARVYFERLSAVIRDRTDGELEMKGRSKRPPRDPVNAMLSFGYSVLAKDMTAITHRVGFDPMVGFLHSRGFGRPALALDLMEEFRPLIVDSTVLRMVAQKQAKHGDFKLRPGHVLMASQLRRGFFRALEQRKKELVSHPVFGYRVSYARTMEVQARLLARWVLGEASEYLPFMTR